MASVRIFVSESSFPLSDNMGSGVQDNAHADCKVHENLRIAMTMNALAQLDQQNSDRRSQKPTRKCAADAVSCAAVTVSTQAPTSSDTCSGDDGSSECHDSRIWNLECCLEKESPSTRAVQSRPNLNAKLLDARRPANPMNRMAVPTFVDASRPIAELDSLSDIFGETEAEIEQNLDGFLFADTLELTLNRVFDEGVKAEAPAVPIMSLEEFVSVA